MAASSADDSLGGRSYARVYRSSGKADVHAFLLEAVRRSAGRVLFASSHKRAPLFLGVETAGDERLGVLVYPFRATRVVTRNRPADESRLQVRYGNEESWAAEEHPIGRDVAGVDVTVVIGVDLAAGVLIGLDPLRYDPLPMGISVELKDEDVDQVVRTGWHAWERSNRPGKRRAQARAPDGWETLIAMRPERFLDYVRLERQAAALALDPPLRFRAALAAATPRGEGPGTRHALERDFELSSAVILDIIARQDRLATAVRGGVAEHHLQRVLEADGRIDHVEAVDRDGGDFLVTLEDQREVLVECKNASPTPYADGDYKVEVQKTRASKGDPASRFYRQVQFDVVAACLFSPTRHWDFRFQRTARLRPHGVFPDRIAAMQRVDQTWAPSLAVLMTN